MKHKYIRTIYLASGLSIENEEESEYDIEEVRDRLYTLISGNEKWVANANSNNVQIINKDRIIFIDIKEITDEER